MHEWMPYASAWLVGFMGSSHCLAMCGGIVSALSFGTRPESPAHRLGLIAAYNVGRISTYALLGLIAGTISYAAMPSQEAWLWARLLSGMFMVLLGLYISGWWKVLVHLEKLGTPLWKRVSPLTRRLLPVDSLPKALLSGMAWGFLPCGMVYSSLAFSASSGSPAQSALIMACFGLGTFPSLLVAGSAAGTLNRLLSNLRFRQVSGLLIIAFGIWTLWMGLPASPAAPGHLHH